MADISREDVATLIQDAYSNTFLETVAETSQVRQAFPSVNMGTKQYKIPVLATIPHAKWVGETPNGAGRKPTAKATWGGKNLVAEELAVIIPIHENTIDDATENVLSDIAVLGGNAIAHALDAAVLFGTAKPATWISPDLYTSADDAGNLVAVSDAAGPDDLMGSIFQAAGLLDDDGYDASDLFARGGLKWKLANLRASDGTPIYMPSLSSAPGSADSVAGLSARFVKGTVLDDADTEVTTWDSDKATSIVVDRERVRIGVRQDITVKFLDQATVGDINLAENDMVALRFKARFAYVLGDIKAESSEGEGETRSPVAAVTGGSGS